MRKNNFDNAFCQLLLVVLLASWFHCYIVNCGLKGHGNHLTYSLADIYGSGHGDVAVLLPGFAVNWWPGRVAGRYASMTQPISFCFDFSHEKPSSKSRYQLMPIIAIFFVLLPLCTVPLILCHIYVCALLSAVLLLYAYCLYPCLLDNKNIIKNISKMFS